MYTVIVIDLYASDPAQATSSYQIQKDLISIGRGRANDIVIRQTNISTQHVTVELTVDGFFLKDLGSTNGTFVNKNQLHGSMRVFGDDEIEVGGARLKLAGHPALDRANEASPLSAPQPGGVGAGAFQGNPAGAPEPLPSDFPAPLPELPGMPQSPPSEKVSLDGLFPFHDSVVLKPGHEQSPQNEINPFPADFPDVPGAVPPSAPSSSGPGLVDKIKQLESKALQSKGSQPARRAAPSVTPAAQGSSAAAPAQSAQSAQSASPFPLDASGNSVVQQTPQAASAPNLADKIKQLESKAIAGGTGQAAATPTPAAGPAPTAAPAAGARNSSVPKALDLFSGGLAQAETTSPTGSVPVADGQDGTGRVVNVRSPLQSNAQSVGGHEATVPGETSGAITPSDPVRPAAFQDFEFDTNFMAIGAHLASAHASLGVVLRKAHETEAEPAQIWALCQLAAQAIALLHSVQAGGGDINVVQAAVDQVLVHLKRALKMAFIQDEFSAVQDDLLASIASLAPLATTNSDRQLGVSSPPLLTVLDQLRTERSKLHKFQGPGEGRENPTTELPVARYTFKAGFEYLESVRGLARSLAEIYFLDELKTLELENVFDEACTNALIHGYDATVGGLIHITVTSCSDNQLIVEVDDEGMPFDTQQANNGAMDGPGLRLMRAFCQEVQFIDRGRLGKRVRLVINLPERFSGIFSSAKIESKKEQTITSATKSEVRCIGLELAVDIPKCAHRASGTSLPDHRQYQLAEIRQRLQSGRQISAVAYTEQGTSVGHLPVYLDDPNEKYGELGSVVILPELANGSLASVLTKTILDKCKAVGLAGIGTIATADHPYEQVSFGAMGGVASGLLLGHKPHDARAAGPSQQMPGRKGRSNAVMMYLSLNPDPAGTVFAPAAYAPVLQEIYTALSLAREINSGAPGDVGVLPAISQFAVDQRPSLGVATIQVREYGDDFIAGLKIQMGRLLAEGYTGIYLDLPIAVPAGQLFIQEVQKLKYIFAGLVPGTRRGDLIRLQFIDNVPVDWNACHVEGALGQALRAHVRGEYQTVWG